MLLHHEKSSLPAILSAELKAALQATPDQEGLRYRPCAGLSYPFRPCSSLDGDPFVSCCLLSLSDSLINLQPQRLCMQIVMHPAEPWSGFNILKTFSKLLMCTIQSSCICVMKYILHAGLRATKPICSEHTCH